MHNEEVNKKVNELLDLITDRQKKSHSVVNLDVVKSWLQEVKRSNK